MTSLIDRYSARPKELKQMCLATFAVNYEVSSEGGNETLEVDIDKEENENNDTMNMMTWKIKLNNGLGT